VLRDRPKFSVFIDDPEFRRWILVKPECAENIFTAKNIGHLLLDSRRI